MDLIRDAGAALQPFLHTNATLSDSYRKQYNDVSDLLTHVGSASWPTQGTPLDPQVTKAEGDCGDG